jgi:hypothetical protein
MNILYQSDSLISFIFDEKLYNISSADIRYHDVIKNINNNKVVKQLVDLSIGNNKKIKHLMKLIILLQDHYYQ